jgi:hypothetical protein
MYNSHTNLLIIYILKNFWSIGEYEVAYEDLKVKGRSFGVEEKVITLVCEVICGLHCSRAQTSVGCSR